MLLIFSYFDVACVQKQYVDFLWKQKIKFVVLNTGRKTAFWVIF